MVKTYTIRIIPPPNIQEIIFQVRNLFPSLDGSQWRNETPHVTLQEAFRTRSITLVQKDLEEIVTPHRPIRVEWNGSEVFSTNALVVKSKKNDALTRLHEDIVETVRSLRTAYCSPIYDREGFRNSYFLDPQHFGFLYLYGMPFSLHFYNPHMSIGYRLTPRSIDHALEFLSRHPLTPWTTEEVVIACKSKQQEGYTTVYSIPLLGKINSHP